MISASVTNDPWRVLCLGTVYTHTEANCTGPQVNHAWVHLFQVVLVMVQLTVPGHDLERLHYAYKLDQVGVLCPGAIKTVGVSKPFVWVQE